MKTTNWSTPPELFEFCSRVVGGFQVDAAGDSTNHLCPRWYGPGSDETDAIIVDQWLTPAFCNPPYQHLNEWTTKFVEQAAKGVHTVAILPARTGTKWWYEGVVKPKANIGFIVGRVAFLDPTGKARVAPNHDSAIVVYGPNMAGVVEWLPYSEILSVVQAGQV